VIKLDSLPSKDHLTQITQSAEYSSNIKENMPSIILALLILRKNLLVVGGDLLLGEKMESLE